MNDHSSTFKAKRDESAKATPGPWIAVRGTEDDPERWCVVSADQFFIAEIQNGRPGDTLETEGANARLIAASPDLLASAKSSVIALRVIPSTLALAGYTLSSEVVKAVILELNAAIEKAEVKA